MTNCVKYQNDRRERCSHAEQAAEEAVRKTFAILGVDINNPKEVEQFRMDLRFGGQLRKASERGRLALYVTFMSALGYALWLGIKLSITQAKP